MKYKSALIIFPHQLFEEHPALLQDPEVVVLIEDSLFFGDSQYPAQFHKQKLWFHRASMTRYASMLREREVAVEYVAHARSQGALPSFISASCIIDLVSMPAKPRRDLIRSYLLSPPALCCGTKICTCCSSAH